MRFAAVLLVTLTVAGCTARIEPPPPVAAPEPIDMVVVLPDRDARVGAVTVTRGSEEQVLNAPYATARIRGDRLEQTVLTPEQMRDIFGPALEAQPPRPVSFTIFFLIGRDEPTPESKQILDQLLAEVRRRPAPEVVVIGHTDRTGTTQLNDVLSRQRAERVRAELIRLGLSAERIEVAGRGDREPLVPTPPQTPEPRNRRVDVIVR